MESRTRRWRRGALVVASLALVAVVGDALANGYGEAKVLVEQAEEAFAEGRDAEALGLLDEALAIQRTVDKKKKPYGYSRWIYLRLGKYWFEKGKKKKAKKYAKKAMRAPESHAWVDEDYWVSPFDPFVVENFPQYAGWKTKKRPEHRIVPSCFFVLPSTEREVFALDGRRFYRLDRETRELTWLYGRDDEHLYGLDAAPGGNEVVFFYEYEDRIYHMTLDPYALERFPLEEGMNHVTLDAGSRSVVQWELGEKDFRVASTQLDPPHATEHLLDEDGQLVTFTSRNLIWATWSNEQGEKFHPYLSPRYEHVIARSLPHGTPETIYTFGVVDSANRLRGMESRSGDRAAVFVTDHVAGTESIIVRDWETGRTFTHEMEEHLQVEPCENYCAPAAAFSWGEDWIVLLDIRDTEVRVLRFDWDAAELTDLATFQRGEDTLLDGRPYSGQFHELGVMEDDATVWIHWGDAMLFVMPDGETVVSDVRKLSKKKKPEWADATYYYPDPAQFLIGIEQGGGRYFMMAPLEKLLP